MANISKIKLPNNSSLDVKALAIPIGTVDSTSTSTVFTFTVPGITSLYDGVIFAIRNTVVASASGWTANVNGLGAKQVYGSNNSRVTTGFAKNYWYIFVYDETNDRWTQAMLTDANSTYTNVALGQGYGTCTTAAATTAKVVTLASYALTTGGIVAVKFDNDVPANATMNINSKGAKAIYHRGTAITDGVIKGGDTAYFIYNTYYHLLGVDRITQNVTVEVSLEWDETTGESRPVIVSGTYAEIKAALIAGRHVVMKVTEGSEIGYAQYSSFDDVTSDYSSPFVFKMRPNNETIWEFAWLRRDIVLMKWGGTSLSVSVNGQYVGWYSPELYEDSYEQEYQSIDISVPTKTSDLTNDSGFISGYTETDPTVPSWAKASTKPTYTASEVGAQDTLVSGTNIKTVNNNSLLGSGNISVGTVTGSSLTANNIILGNGSSTIKSSGKTIATTLGTDDTTVPTSKAVKDAIDALPEPMIFKGTLGTGGTITSLPAAAAGNTGYTYKVITNGTYQSIAAKAGDTFISNGSSWTLIPSGDEPSGTVTSVTLKATSPIAIDSSTAITTSGTRTISHADSGVTAGTYKSVTVDAKGHVTGGTNPTTLSGYGITDAKIANGIITLGNNTITPLTADSSLKEAFLTWGGKNFSAGYGPIDAAMIPELGANRLAFLNPSTTAIEYSKDGGSTWIDYDATDAQKIALVSGLSGSFIIGKSTTAQVATANDKLRITIEANGLYTTLNKFAIYVSTSGSTGCTCTVMSRTRANYDSNTDTWVTKAENVSISGWSGWNIINIPSGITFGNNASQYRQIRFIFSATGHSGGSYAGLTIVKLLGFGGQGWTVPSTMALNGHLYSYDADKNATFPAKVTATSFAKTGGTSSQFLKADGSVDSNTYLTSAAVATMTQNEVDSLVNTIFS